MKNTAILAVLCALTRKVSATCAEEMPNLPQPGQTHRTSIMVDDPNYGQVERFFALHLPAGYSIGNDVPTPLVLDFHGHGGDSAQQQYIGGLDDASDEDAEGGFIVVHGDGNGDSITGKQSWNCSRTDGPLGPPCVLPRPDEFVQCYETCPECDTVNSCDFTACLDDIAFVRAVVDHVRDNYCLDADSVHLTGISNGGMFSYYAASKLSNIIASIAPNAASPLIGFGDVPVDSPVSLIDFHGLLDSIIPYDLDSVFSRGEGPHDSLIAYYYFYHEQKPNTIAKWVNELGCGAQETYPTEMDGIDGWSCNLWPGCQGGTEVVHCNGVYGHWYPFGGQDPPHIGGTKIMWDFMKRHRKNK